MNLPSTKQTKMKKKLVIERVQKVRSVSVRMNYKMNKTIMKMHQNKKVNSFLNARGKVKVTVLSKRSKVRIDGSLKLMNMKVRCCFNSKNNQVRIKQEKILLRES